MLNVFYYYHILSYSLGSIFYQYTRGAQKVMSHVFFSRILFAQNVCNSRTVQLDVSFTHDIFPYSLHLRLRPYASAKQGHACLYQLGSCSRSHVLTAWITLSSSSNLVPRSASFSGPKRWKSDGARSGLWRGWGNTFQPNLAIASWVRRLLWGQKLSCWINMSPGFLLGRTCR